MIFFAWAQWASVLLFTGAVENEGLDMSCTPMRQLAPTVPTILLLSSYQMGLGGGEMAMECNSFTTEAINHSDQFTLENRIKYYKLLHNLRLSD